MEHMWWDICSLPLHHPCRPDGCSSVQRVSIWAQVGAYCMLGDFHLFHQLHCTAWSRYLRLIQVEGRRISSFLRGHIHIFFASNGGKSNMWVRICQWVCWRERDPRKISQQPLLPTWFWAAVPQSVSSGPTRWQLQTEWQLYFPK